MQPTVIAIEFYIHNSQVSMRTFPGREGGGSEETHQHTWQHIQFVQN